MGQLNQIKRNNKLLHVLRYLKKDYQHEINRPKHRRLNQQVRHHNRSLNLQKKKIFNRFSQMKLII
jgi:hypothetical protein